MTINQIGMVFNEFIDDDTMATASAVNVCSGESIKAYVDNVAGSGFTVILTCLLGTTATLSGTYANGASGVGATLTNNSTQVALTIDGVLTQVADRVLVKDQTAELQNGVYTVTVVGDGSTNWELTRATDYDTAAEIIAGTLVPVSDGTVNGGSIWLQTATVSTVGTDSVVFSEFAQPSSTYVTIATNQAITGAKTFSNNVVLSGSSTLDLNGSTAVDGIINDDTMATASATNLSTSEAIKAYVDAQAGAAASQVQMEAASSTTTYSSPGRQQYHPGHPKAWVEFNGTGTVTINASYNVTSITDNGTGDYTVNMTTPFSTINYCAVGNCGTGTSVAYSSGTAAYVTGPQAVPTASAWRFGTGQGAVGAQPGVRVDRAYISVALMGDQ